MKIYFDTSAINAITDDPQKPRVVDKLTTNHECLISSLSLTEILASQIGERRVKLLNVASRLSKVPGSPPHKLLVDVPEMLRRAIEAFVNPSVDVNYFKTIRDFPQLPLLVNPRNAIYDDVRDLARGWTQATESRHHNQMKSMRDESQEAFKFFPLDAQKAINSGRSAYLRGILSQSDLLESCMASILQNPKYNNFNAELMGREFEILEASDVCRFHLAQQAIEMYNRLVQKEGFGKPTNPGWVDVNQAVYLAVADVFVTNDANQREFMRLVARFSKFPRKVCSYVRLKDSLGI